MLKIYLEYFGLLFVAYLMHYSSAIENDEECSYNLPPHTSVVKSHNGDCYQFVDTEKRWPDAREYCWQYGGKLVTINDAETTNFIKTTLEDLPWTNKGIWIGLHDRVTELSFEWVTKDKHVGQVMTYHNWARGHPNGMFNRGRDCVTMRRNSHWKWHEAPCDLWGFSYRFICQYGPIRSALQNQEEIPQIIEKMDLLDRNVIIENIEVEIHHPTKSPSTTGKNHQEITILNSTMGKNHQETTKLHPLMRKFHQEATKLPPTMKKIIKEEVKQPPKQKKMNKKIDDNSKYKIVEDLYSLEKDDQLFLKKVEVHNFYGSHEASALRMKQIRPAEFEHPGSSKHLYILFTCLMVTAFVILIIILLVRRLKKVAKPVVVIFDEDTKAKKLEPPKKCENEYIVNVYSNPMPASNILAKLPAIGLDDEGLDYEKYDNGYLRAVNGSNQEDDEYECIDEQVDSSDLLEENMYHVIPGDTEYDPIYASVDELK